jgi:5-formyltetrahydrofolate cyclo-ligase
VRGRIPNVRDADAAAERLSHTREWQQARVVKVNPDAPQQLLMPILEELYRRTSGSA